MASPAFALSTTNVHNAEYSLTALHPDEVRDGEDFRDSLSSPIEKSIAFPTSYDDKYGEIVQLENGNYAYLPCEGLEPVIVEASTLSDLSKALVESRSLGLINVSDPELGHLFSKAFLEVYK